MLLGVIYIQGHISCFFWMFSIDTWKCILRFSSTHLVSEMPKIQLFVHQTYLDYIYVLEIHMNLLSGYIE